ncbi:hypothetical protein AA0112_g9281 [Alternaria arborescens]|nr:hypothetical protein AA0112_g9281 [Alternaria arborescens]
MEVAGVVIGAVALIGVFEDCIELFSQIGAARSMENDYILLATRLDLQKAILLQWAERLRLYEAKEHDTRLDDPMLGPVIHKGLDCIRQLLQNGNVLQQRYGVRPTDSHETTDPQTVPDQRRLPNHLLGQIRKPKRQRSDVELSQPQSSNQYPGDDYTPKRARCSSRDQNDPLHPLPDRDYMAKPSRLDRIMWVIKDKDQFEGLIRKLSDLIADIDKAVPPRAGELPTRALLEYEIQGLKSVRELRIIMHASRSDNRDLAGITQQTIDRQCAKLILNRLWFRLIDDRKNNIAEAHLHTLNWAINPPASDVVWDDLGEWLRSGRDFYWISGKPGSGKSTLMKFLYGHPKVISDLKIWARGRQLTMAPFFLWNIGSVEQNSQEGLARGLLHHVLTENPTLISTVLPNMWQEAQSGSVDLQLPTNIETKTAFQRLGAATTTGAFAFFIDGLDEFTGNPRDGISFVKSLVTSSNIKILVSSRPIDTCVAAFSSAPTLRLQDLTKPDIEMYINDIVRSHPYVADSNYLCEMTVEGLIDDIRNKANGVFLWVVLACRTLLEGFEAFDNAEELQRRVEELPPELESLFRHILNSLPPRFLQQAAKLLQLCYLRRYRLSSEISAFTLAWAHEKDMKLCELDKFYPVKHSDRIEKCVMLEGRLRSRCRGLLEVQRDPKSKIPISVDFMHRTVFEFLDTPDVWTLDCMHIDDRQFDATTVLAYMSCYDLFLQDKSIRHEKRFAQETYYCLQEVQNDSPWNLPHLLNRVAFAFMRERGNAEPVFGPSQDILSLADASILLAVEFDLTSFFKDYDESRLDTEYALGSHGMSIRVRFNLLYHALAKPLMYGILDFARDTPCSTAIVDLLLRSGCDPNGSLVRLYYHLVFDDNMGIPKDSYTTPWDEWMNSAEGIYLGYANDDPLSGEEVSELALTTVLMIRAGANIVDHRNKLRETAESWLEIVKGSENSKDRETREYCNEIVEAATTDSEDNSSISSSNSEEILSATDTDHEEDNPSLLVSDNEEIPSAADTDLEENDPSRVSTDGEGDWNAVAVGSKDDPIQIE